MGGQSCKLKIILNGGTIENELHEICYNIQENDVVIPDDAGYKMVEYLNQAEDLIFKFKRAYLESQGFTGPFPHAMDYK